jgi:hypothetical protein
MLTWGGMTPPSIRLMVYIDSVSPTMAGLSADATCPVVACQMAPCPCALPPSENNTGAGTGWTTVVRTQTRTKKTMHQILPQNKSGRVVSQFYTFASS